MASYFFASTVDVDVSLEGEDDRKQVEIKSEKEKTIKCPVYYDGESLVGQVRSSCHCLRNKYEIPAGYDSCSRREEARP